MTRGAALVLWRDCVSFWVRCDHCGHFVQIHDLRVRRMRENAPPPEQQPFDAA
jgi:hypothetical protein